MFDYIEKENKLKNLILTGVLALGNQNGTLCLFIYRYMYMVI